MKLDALYGGDVARILRTARSTVAFHLKAGRLRILDGDVHKRKGPRFDPMSVCELALARCEGTELDLAQELFSQKANVLETASILGVTPERARELYREWCTPFDVDTKRMRDDEKADEERAAKRTSQLDEEWERRRAERKKERVRYR